MPDLELNILIEDAFIDLVSEKWLRRVVRATLSAAGMERPAEMGIVIAGDSTVRDLNRTYRDIDDTTDVLAFALSQPAGSEREDFVMPPEETTHLGEIVISAPRAQAQAQRAQHSLDSEMALLTCHGVLHLMGHDHEDAEDERRMRAMESKVLRSIGVE